MRFNKGAKRYGYLLIAVLLVVGLILVFRTELRKNKETSSLTHETAIPISSTTPTINWTITVDKLVELTNEARVSAGLKPLKVDKSLEESASLKAKDMMDLNYFGHEGPVGSKDYLYLISSVGYNYVYAGENLAEDYTNVQDLFNGWMNSEGHKKNILSKNYNDIGISVLSGFTQGRYTTLVVQHFGTMYDAKNPNNIIECRFPYSGTIMVTREKCNAMIDCEVEIGKWQAVYKSDCDKLMESILKSMKK